MGFAIIGTGKNLGCDDELQQRTQNTQIDIHTKISFFLQKFDNAKNKVRNVALSIFVTQLQFLKYEINQNLTRKRSIIIG